MFLLILPLVVALPAAFDDQEANAIQFEMQSTLQLEVRSPPEFRPLLPAATRDLHRTKPRHTLHSARTTPKRTHQHARAAALERGQDDPSRDELRHQPLLAQGHQPTTAGVPASRQPRMQRAQLSVGPLPLRARDRCTCCRCTRARVPSAPAPAPTTTPPRGAPDCARAALAISTCERTRRLACFADCLRVAPQLQAAAAASGRARRPLRPRHLRHDRQAQRRHHGHDDPAAVTPALTHLAQAAQCLCL